jgi:hypothetical protein
LFTNGYYYAPVQHPCYHCTCTWMACSSWCRAVTSIPCSRPTVKWSGGAYWREHVGGSVTQYIFFKTNQNIR